MDSTRSCIAKRTRAKRKEDFDRMLAEYCEKKPREKNEREREKSCASRSMNAEEKNGEESMGDKVNPINVEICQNGLRDDERKGEDFNPNKLKKRRRETVGMSQSGFDEDEETGSDAVILREEKNGGEVNPNESNKRREAAKNGQIACDVHEGSASEEEIGVELNSSIPNKRRRKTAQKGQNGCDGNEGSGCHVKFSREEAKGEEVNLNKLEKRETNKKCHSDSDYAKGRESGSDIEIMAEVFVPPDQRYKHVKNAKHFPFCGKRGRIDGNRTYERRSSGVAGVVHSGNGHKEKGKDVMIENLDASESGSSSSEEETDDFDENDNKEVKSVSSGSHLHGLDHKKVMMEHLDASESESSSSQEDNDDVDVDDSDYEEEEPVSFNSQTDGLDYSSDADLEGKEDDKDDGKTSPAERHFIKERKEFEEDEVSSTKTALDGQRENLVGDDGVSEDKIEVGENGLKERKVCALDTEDDSSMRDKVRRSRLQRLRPRLPSVSESRRKKLSLGKSENSPISVSESEDSDSLDEEDDGYDDPVPKHRTKSRRKVEKLAKGVPADSNFISILLDSMLKEDDTLKEKLAPPEAKDADQNVLPLKFRFEDEDPAPPEKDEWEIEIDGLFAELERGLTVAEPDSTMSTTADSDDVTATSNSPAERCLRGEHQLILEEPTGIICKCCQLVYMEMKYIFPDLKVQRPRRRDRFDFRGGDCFSFDKLHLGDSGCKDYYTSILAEGSVLNLIPADIRMSMYDHQLDGFLFLWKNIVGETSMEKLTTQLSDDGRGCIVSHEPGTGKTCLTIVFILALMKIYPICRPLIIAPLSMLHTWEREFKKWGSNIPFRNLSITLKDNEREFAKDILRKMGSDKNAGLYAKLYCWMNERSILGTTYQLFERLASGCKKEKNAAQVRKILLEQPGLVVLDEGHIARNRQSRIWKVLTEVKTRRRIILTGTLFQNNFDELYNTLSLVNPMFSEWRRKNNVHKERWVSLTNAIDENSDEAIGKMKAMIGPFMHVYKGKILQDSLPGIKDTLVILRPTDQQKHILQQIPDGMKYLVKTNLMSLISVHPSLAAVKQLSFDRNRLRELEGNPDAGVKVKFVIELIRLCVVSREKVLVFSEYIPPLRFMMKQLEHKFSWREGKEMLYMDGERDVKDRQSSISSFNDPTSEVNVLLASTKACSEGINLVGASRVVLLDVVWNPSVEKQAISRAYRIGQQKFVYVYHLITSETLDFYKYNRQAIKDRLAELVFSCQDRQNSKASISSTEDKILEAMLDNNLMNGVIENIVYKPKGIKFI